MHCSIVNLGYYMWCMMCCHECVCVDQELSPFVWPTRKHLLLWNYMPKEKAKRLLISCHTFLWCHMIALQWAHVAKKWILPALQWAHEAKGDFACDSHWIPFYIMIHFGNFWAVYVIYMWTWAFVRAICDLHVLYLTWCEPRLLYVNSMWTWMCVED